MSQLSLKNFAIVEQLTLELTTGMTTVTGETGAGKSILIDALDLVLGGRGNANMIRHGTERTELSAIFNLHHIPAAQQWLRAHDFTIADDEVLLRRSMTKEGRSRHFINGDPCTQQQMRKLGELLLNIHGQHEHQQLLQRHKQREIFDAYAQHGALLTKVKNTYQQIQQIKQQLAELQGDHGGADAKLVLLQYQVKELRELSLAENEIHELEEEHKRLAHAEQLRTSVQTALTAIDDNDAATAATLLAVAHNEIQQIIHLSPSLKSSLELLDTATIQIQEASSELNHYINAIEINPERLVVVELRLNQIHDLARKHHIEPEALLTTQEKLAQELEHLEHADEYKTELEVQLKALLQDYKKAAKQLSHSRAKSAKTLSQLVSANMQTLGMAGGEFSIQLTPLAEDEISMHGAEHIEFFVTANPGQPLQALNKVASGGEMSRISLALQMITAEKENTPTLIFDEVDVGIGGATAEVVGKLLRQLGEKAQVLCITHLPQVAAQAHQHLQVQKTTKNQQTHATILSLDQQLRIEEIARMLGGVDITEQTLSHAKEMLTQNRA